METIGCIKFFCIAANILGPFKRLVVYFQGCPHRCEGCQTTELQRALPARDMTEMITRIIDTIKSDTDIKGITVSGGEPFAQPSLLITLLKRIKSEIDRPLDILSYSGFKYESLLLSPTCRKALSYVDVLIDGPYIATMATDEGISGSTNQRYIYLNPDPKLREAYASFERERHGGIVSDDRGRPFYIGLSKSKGEQYENCRTDS